MHDTEGTLRFCVVRPPISLLIWLKHRADGWFQDTDSTVHQNSSDTPKKSRRENRLSSYTETDINDFWDHGRIGRMRRELLNIIKPITFVFQRGIEKNARKVPCLADSEHWPPIDSME